MHDSVSFYPTYELLSEEYKDRIKNICLDAGYITLVICKTILENEQKMYAPYKRPMTKKAILKYVYDGEYNCYIFSNIKILGYSTTNKLGYREYKSNP